jgi:UDP-N-acetylmuramyl pentapeptide synthase
MEIVEGMAPDGQLLLNGDNDMLQTLQEKPVQPITWFGCGDNCTVRGSSVTQTEEMLSFMVHCGAAQRCWCTPIIPKP